MLQVRCVNDCIAVLLRIPKDAFTDPDHYTCKSSSLLRIKGKHRVHLEDQKKAGESSEAIDDQIVPADSASGSQHVKWNLRPRDSSDRSSQPHSAPTDLAAQQSENFKRFYRAVVSPSHVRVTAGGRIVPNTRAIGVPLFEWNNEKQIYESRKQSAGSEFKPLRLAPLLPATGFNPAFPQLLPAGFFPAYNHAQSSLQPLTVTAVQNLGSFGGRAHLPAPAGDSAVDAAHSASTGQPINISHPSQFDHSKPFIFNGQLVYPIPPGHLPPSYAHPVPVSMIGNPSPVPGAVPPAGFFMPQPAMPIASANDHNAVTYGQNAVLSHSSPNLPVGNGGLHNPYLPLAGPASVADITKFQIEGFRNHLSFIEDQLANNQLGIDVQYLEGQQSDLKALIEKMEAMLTLQLAYGQRQDAAAFLNGVMQLEAQNQLAKGTMGEAVRQDVGKSTGVSSSTKSKEEPVAPSVAPTPRLNKVPINTESRLTDGENIVKRQTQASSTASKSRLTPAAAMAPPFQPRPQAMVAANSFSGISAPSTHRSTYTDSFGPRITSWANGSYTPSLPGVGHKNIPTALPSHRSSAYSLNESLPTTVPGIPATDVPYTAPSDQTMPLISPAAVPYLIGTVPQGVQGIDSKATVHQYPRPLTDEERRARFLYWGRAPRSAYDGLPKFDGKDFYPPSPTKEPTRLRTNSPIANHHSHRHLTPIERNFEKLFATPGSTNSKAPSLDLASGQQNGSANMVPNASQSSSVGSFRSHRSPNTPKGHSSPWYLKDQGHGQANHGLGTGNSISHSRGPPILPDLSKLFIDGRSSRSNSPGSARLSVRQFNSDTAKANNGPGNVKLHMDNGELGGQADSVGSWRASPEYYGVGRGKVGQEVGRQSSPRGIRSTLSLRGASGRPGYEHNLLSRAESSSR
jgi:hypothetical protein